MGRILENEISRIREVQRHTEREINTYVGRRKQTEEERKE